MNKKAFGILLVLLALLLLNVPSRASADVPVTRTRIAGGGLFSLALQSDGTVRAWGSDTQKQCDVPTDLTNAVAVAAGVTHCLALQSDGTVRAWGDDTYNKCDVPTDLTNVVAVAAGKFHSLALQSDGTVVAWGRVQQQQCAVPTGLTGVKAVAAGLYHSLALQSDGTVVAWGSSTTAYPVPTGLTNVVAVAARNNNSLALKSDGTVVEWGSTTSTYPVPSDLANVVAIAAGDSHSLALQSDGTVRAWGDDTSGQCDVPTDLTGVVAIAAGQFHSLALKSDGTVVAWGGTSVGSYGLTTVPSGLNLANLLTGLTLSQGSLSPGFDSGVFAYTASVDNSVSSIDVTPTAVSDSVYVGGTAAVSGEAFSVPLAVGDNTITIVASTADGLTKTYTVTVTRAEATLSSDATLSALALSSGTLSPAFASTTTGYTDSVDNSTGSITVTPTSNESHASIAVNNTPVTSGSASQAVTLNVGSNTVTVLVTAQDNSTKTYTVTVTRPAAPAEAPVITPGNGSYDIPKSINVSISANLGVDQAVYYTTNGSDPTVAGSVYYTGPFSLSLGQGTTTVQAAVYDSGSGVWSGVGSAVFTVNAIYVHVTGVSLNKDNLALTVGGSETLTATIAPDNATNPNGTWSSNKESVATVDSTGKVTAVAPGSATITVTTVDGGKTDTCDVNVQAATVPVTVTSVVHIPDVKVNNGTSLANVSLPVKATVNLSDGATASVSVTWDNGALSYDGKTAGTYFFSGTIGGLLSNVTNPDNVKASMQVTVLQQEQPTTVTGGTTEIPVTAGQPQSVQVPQGVTPPPITSHVTTTETGQKQTTLPLFNASIQQTIQNTTQTVLMQIPDQTTATGSAFWNGQIQMPHVVSSSSVTAPGSSTVNLVLQLGDSDQQLNFDKAVRILLPGMAGNSIGYTEGNGDVIPITYLLSADTQQAADKAFFSDHPVASAGYVNVNNDLAVWTSHFCKLVVYSVSSSPAPSSGGGGGGGITAPGVQTSDATSVTDTTANLTGSVTSDGGTSITAYGFLWGVDQNNLDQKQQAGTDNHSGSFQAGLSGLKPETTYYFKAYATNSKSTTQGGLKQFTTPKAGAQQPQPPTQPGAGTTFTDVSASHWAHDAITRLSTLGILGGYPDGNFRPDSQITRAELVSIMDKALKLSAAPAGTGTRPATPGFSDVSSGDWFYGAVERAAQAGIVKGSGSVFSPNDPITREQLACILVNALGKQDEAQAGMSGKTGFTDDAGISGWARGFVAAASKDGLIRGYQEDNSFRPQHSATRAEACAMIVNLLNATK